MSFLHAVKKACVLGWTAIALTLLAGAPGYSDSTKDTASAYFAALKKDFDKLAANRAMAKTKASPVNALFAAAIKKNPTITSLVKVNARGVITNETVKGQKPKKKSLRKIGKAEWYVKTVKNKKAFSGISEEKGRYYLTWTKPLLGAKKRIAGVVAVKIDVGGCFDKVSKETTAPYLVRQENNVLYAHNWKNDTSFLEEPMTIPGIAKVTFLTEKPVAAAAEVARAPEPLDISVQKVNAVPATPSQQATPAKPEPVKKAPAKISKKRVLEIIIAAIVILLLIILLFRFYIWLNHKFLMHSINKRN